MSTHVRLSLLLVALAVPACSKKNSESGSTTGSGAAPGSAASDRAATHTEHPPTSPAPDVTSEMLLAEPPQFVIDAMGRGLWISVNSNEFRQNCRVSLGTAMVRAGKIRDAAKAAPDALSCENKEPYAVCTFAPADADKENPDSRGSWIFVKDEDWKEPVLVAVVIGDFDWAKVASAIPAKTPCPKPSADPQ